MKRFIIAIIVSVSATFLIIIVLNLLPKERKKVKGIIVSIKAGGGENDIVFKMKDDSKTYYINRGLQYGLNLDSLAHYFLNKKGELHYSKTRLMSSPHPIIKVETVDKTIYRIEQSWEIR